MNAHQKREERIRPAVDELAQSHRELFEQLELGFETRGDLLLWLHKASALTLGRIPDEFAVETLSSRYRTAALLERTGEHVADEDAARHERELIRDDVLLDPCSTSMRFIAQTSNQYGAASEDGSKDGKFGPQRWLAMRPALGELVSRQRTALRRVVGRDPEYPNGLETHDDLSTWVRSVIQASRGMDGGLTREALWSPWWRQALAGNVSAVDLHLRLADDVLRVFNAAIREEATQATEAPDTETTDQRRFER